MEQSKKNKMPVVAILAAASILSCAAVLATPYITSAQIDDAALGLAYPSAIGLSAADPRAVAASIIRAILGVLGVVALVIVIVGGWTWMTAGGNEEKVAEAKKWMGAGVIGLAIILSAYAITSFVIRQLVTATANTTPIVQ
jgi:hypothetical protein